MLTFVNRIRKCNYTVYTSLPIEKSIETFSDNKLEIINKKHLKAEMIDGNSINIIGMKLSEIGFMDEEIYLEILDKTVREYPTATINYYPHRGESENKLRKISDQGYIIHKNNLPIEEFFLKNGAPRGIYLTFYSTALYNLSNMLDKCVFYAIEPNITFWPEKHRKGISMCYDLFRAAGIHTRQIKLGIINA